MRVPLPAARMTTPTRLITSPITPSASQRYSAHRVARSRASVMSKCWILARAPGFEPGIVDPKSTALPLGHARSRWRTYLPLTFAMFAPQYTVLQRALARTYHVRTEYSFVWLYFD